MLLNKNYIDPMDNSRELCPTSVSGKSASCRVYFDGVFTGKADVPVSLFVDNPTGEENARYMPQSERVGFILNLTE